MKIEYEATFKNIDKAKCRAKLEKAGAKLVKTEFLQKRCVFNLPSGHEMQGAWLRVRDEQDKITMSFKMVNNNSNIADQKEIELKISNFEAACELLEIIGCEKKAYQENLRERWELDGVEVTIDEWPYLEPFIEIESDSEMNVKTAAEKLGFEYNLAYFGSVDGLYSEKYKITETQINNKTPLILFKMDKNPFKPA